MLIVQSIYEWELIKQVEEEHLMSNHIEQHKVNDFILVSSIIWSNFNNSNTRKYKENTQIVIVQ